MEITDDQSEKLFTEYSKKSKRICAHCERPFKDILRPKNFKGKAWCKSVVFTGEIRKSEKVKLCGDCFQNGSKKL